MPEPVARFLNLWHRLIIPCSHDEPNLVRNGFARLPTESQALSRRVDQEVQSRSPPALGKDSGLAKGKADSILRVRFLL